MLFVLNERIQTGLKTTCQQQHYTAAIKLWIIGPKLGSYFDTVPKHPFGRFFPPLSAVFPLEILNDLLYGLFILLFMTTGGRWN